MIDIYRNNKILVSIAVLLFFLLVGNNTGWCQSTDGDSEGDKIFLTWQNLKELLDFNSDTIKITWEAFQKLLAQTGNRVDMNFEIKDGMVTIKRDQFRQILGKMLPPVRKLPAASKDYLITEALYSGTAGKKNSRFTALFKIYIFKRKEPAFINIPIIHTNLALKDIRVNNAPAVILTRGSWHNITLKQSGYHEIKVIFSAGQGKHALYLPVVRSAINRIDYTVFTNDLAITINPSLNVRVKNPGNATQISAHFPPTNRIQVNWIRKAKKREKQPALFYADTRSLISVDADILRVKTRVSLDVIQGSLNTVSLLVPGNYEVTKIEGKPVREWQVRETDIGRVLEIPFRYDIDRSTDFILHAERILAEETLAADFVGFRVIDARRETGDIGVAAESTVEVQVEEKESRELEKLEYHKLPGDILKMSPRPILFAFKYTRHPYRFLIHIQKHERMEGITTVIESAEMTALFLEEGKVLCHIIYTVRNIFKQFMGLGLPPGAGIWTVYVDNKRGKASRNKEGNILIPLLRSPGNGEHIKPFQVELIYTLPMETFGSIGKGECLIPSSDIFINKMRVTLYMPRGLLYTFDKSRWKEEKPAAPREEREEDFFLQERISFRDSKDMIKTGEIEEGVISSEDESRGKKPGAVPKPPPYKGARVTGKIKSDVQVQAVTAPVGISSIRVHLPLSGSRFIFTKKVIDKHETFPLSFSYFSRKLKNTILYLVMIVLIIGTTWIIRRKFQKRKGEA